MSLVEKKENNGLVTVEMEACHTSSVRSGDSETFVHLDNTRPSCTFRVTAGNLLGKKELPVMNG